MSLQLGRYDFEITKGTSFSLTLGFNNDDGSAIDITNYQFQLVVNLMGANGKITFGNTDFIKTQTNEVRVSKGGTQTQTYRDGIFPYVFSVILPNGDFEDWCFGECTIKNQSNAN